LLGTPVEIAVDMVVLGTGLTTRKDSEKVAQVFGISQSADGFFMEAHPKLRPVSTNVDGVFVAGCCQGPKIFRIPWRRQKGLRERFFLFPPGRG